MFSTRDIDRRPVFWYNMTKEKKGGSPMLQSIRFLLEDILQVTASLDWRNALLYALLFLVSLATGGTLQWFSFTRGRKAFHRVLPLLCSLPLPLLALYATWQLNAQISSAKHIGEEVMLAIFFSPIHTITIFVTLAWFACAVVLLVLSIKRLCTKILCRG